MSEIIFSSSFLLSTIVTLMVVVFLTQRLPLDLTALLALFLLVLAGYVTPAEAFQGFSSPTIITMVSTFFITAALQRTGVTDYLGRFLYRFAGKSEARNVLIVVLTAAFVSSFMNNLAATALLMPAVTSLSLRSLVSPSKLLIPLSFGTVLGGTTTLIGTTPNILATDILQRRGVEPFHFLEFTPFGVAIVCFGLLFLCLVGRRWLPNGTKNDLRDPAKNLPSVYRLQERTFTLRVPKDWSKSGTTLKELHFGEELGASVDEIRRGERYIQPDGQTSLEIDDLLVVRGRLFEFEALARLRGVSLNLSPDLPQLDPTGVTRCGTLELNNNSFTGRKLREIHIKEQFGVLVVAVERGGKFSYENLADYVLSSSDRIHIVGSEECFGKLRESELFKFASEGGDLRTFLGARLLSLELPASTLLKGVTIFDSHLGRLAGITVLAVHRDNNLLVAPSTKLELCANDILLISGDAEHAKRLLCISELQVEDREVQMNFDSAQKGLVEVVLSPRSSIIGQSLEAVSFRAKYGFQVIAVWRHGNPIRARLARLELEFGDALLLYGNKSRISLLRESPDFVLLGDVSDHSPDLRRAPVAVGGLFILVVLSVFKIFPVEMCAFIGALFVVALGAISMTEAYKEIDWRIIMLVGALLPVGLACERSGVLFQISSGLTHMANPYVLLLALCLTSSLISQLLDATLAMILLIPISIDAAMRFGFHPHSFAMATTLAASLVFMTPFSNRSNLLIMAAGGYKTRDYMKTGTGLSIILLAVIMILIPLVYGMM